MIIQHIYKRALNSISINLRRLCKLGQNSVFVSQFDGEEVDHASIIIALVPDDDKNEEYLKLRRLFKALEYRFNHEIEDYELKVNVRRKAKR